MAETLASTLNSRIDPLNLVGQVSKEPSPQRRASMVREAQPELMRQESEAEQRRSEAEIGAKRRQAEEEAFVEESFATGMEAAGKRLTSAADQMPERRVQDFDPDAGIELASMAALLGAFAGSLSGQSALKAMKGITEGYRAGKQDLYERSVNEFEAEMSKYKQKVANAKAEYEVAMKKEAAKRGAGIAHLKLFAPELSDTVAAARLQVNDIKGYRSALEKMGQLGEQMDLKAFEAGIKPKTTTPRLATIMGEDKDGNYVPLVVNVNDPAFDAQNVREGAPAVYGKAPPKTSEVGSRERTFAQRVFGSIKGMAEDAKNLLTLPGNAAMPEFAGVVANDPNSIIGSLVAMSAREITEPESRAFQQITEQIAQAMANIEGQGLASGATAAKVRAFDALRPKAGDNAINMALYFARVRQELQTGIEVFLTNYGANEEQKRQARQIYENLKTQIPFTVEDVFKSVINKVPGGQQTLSEDMEKLIRQKPFFIELQPEQEAPQSQQQFTEGQKSTSKSGRPIVFRNGAWEYE